MHPEQKFRHIILLAQAQRVLGILLGPCGRARCIANAAGCILGHITDALGRVTDSTSCTLDGVAKHVTEAADCSGVSCQNKELQVRAKHEKTVAMGRIIVMAECGDSVSIAVAVQRGRNGRGDAGP